MNYKLGIDLGSTSLGWAALDMDDNGKIIGLRDLGVRIFPDGRDAKKHTPINVERRNARTMRRRGDRVKERVQKTLTLLSEYGWNFTINPENDNPYQLRADALVRQLEPAELGRVFFHLSLRRGFKSNRKDLNKDGGGKLKAAQDALNDKLQGRTLGTAQAAGDVAMRFSNQFIGTKIKDGALYPTRQMYENEFNAICDYQHVSDDKRTALYDAIFYQRPLKPQDVGTCVFEVTQKRAYKYEPIFQRWRALQQINQLRIMNGGTAEELSETQIQKIREIVFDTFEGVKKGKITFAELKRQLGLSNRSVRFNLESEARKDMDVDKTAFSFYQIDELDFWHKLTSAQQSELLSKINDDGIEDSDIIKYIVNKYNISEERAEKITEINIEEGTASVSIMAMNKMLPFLEQGQMYHEAAEHAGYHHSDFDIPNVDLLPYYGELSLLKPHLVEQKGIYRTTNATVHIALNQIRALVNELVIKWGKPSAINVEVARDLRSGAKELSGMASKQVENKNKNDEIRESLAGIGIEHPSHEDFQKYKLWEALAKNPIDRKCIYTGTPITSITELFHGNRFEIEHILPFAQTMDDSMANKTISLVDANRFKGNRTPYDAFNDPKSPWKYEDILERAKTLPDNVKWRFNKDALKDYLRDSDGIARALNDTRHMSRIATLYLKHICTDKNAVAALPGQMTALFRDMWHLDWWKRQDNAEKYRGSHIHHAIDALVIACMNRGNLQKLSETSERLATSAEYYGQTLKEKREKLFSEIDKPFDGFDYFAFKEKCENTHISYRPNIKNPAGDGTIGQLNQDTAYSLVDFKHGTIAQFSCMESVTGMNDKNFRYLNQKTMEMFLVESGVTNEDPEIFKKFKQWCAYCGTNKVRIIHDDIDTTTYIPVFRTCAERDECRKAYMNWYIQDDIADGIKEKICKKNQKDKEAVLLSLYQNAARRAYKWFVGGNNFQAEVFAIRKDDKRYPKLAGKWQTEIMSNYNAVLDKGIPMWVRKYPTARRIMSLRANDIVRAEFSRNDENLPKGLIESVNHRCFVENKETIELNLRVKKLSSNGVIYLRPDWIAKEDENSKSWCASAKSLLEHKARKVFVSPAGVMTDPGFSE